MSSCMAVAEQQSQQFYHEVGDFLQCFVTYFVYLYSSYIVLIVLNELNLTVHMFLYR